MKFKEKYKARKSTTDKPSSVVGDILSEPHLDVEAVLRGLDFESVAEVAETLKSVWFAVIEDKYIASKQTQALIPQAKILLNRATRLLTSPTFEKTVAATAEGLWLKHFEQKKLTKRCKETFNNNSDKTLFEQACVELRAIYGFTDEEVAAFWYFVCQCRRSGGDPILNRSLYIWSKEKMTGKTTVAKIIAGIMNGWRSWEEVLRHAGGFMSDIATELQFGTFDKPKAVRYNCVLMDEAFTGKSTSKFYGKFKAAMTSSSCDVQVKFGNTYEVNCKRNYIFTSNNEISSIIADEQERRFFVIEMKKPQPRDYEELFRVWFQFCINAPDREDVAAWYKETSQQVKGERGIQIDDIVSALYSEDFRTRLTDQQALGRYQVAFPHFFTFYMSQNYDVKGRGEVVKEAVLRAFGEVKSSGTRRYFNITTLLSIINAQIEQGGGGFLDFDTKKEEINGEDLPY